jgi:hypothetical protein
MYIITSKNGGAFKRNTDFDNFLLEEKRKKKAKRRAWRKKYFCF